MSRTDSIHDDDDDGILHLKFLAAIKRCLFSIPNNKKLSICMTTRQVTMTIKENSGGL